MTTTFIQVGDKVRIHCRAKEIDQAAGRVVLHLNGDTFGVDVGGDTFGLVLATSDELELLDRCELCGKKLDECPIRDGYYYTCDCQAP